MNFLKRTHYCAEVTKDLIGQDVVVCGFVQKVRNLGNLIFIDVRDRSGIVQIAMNSKTDEKILDLAQQIRAEFVVSVKGQVKRRDSVNKTISNGDVEIYVSELYIVSKAQTPPFEVY